MGTVTYALEGFSHRARQAAYGPGGRRGPRLAFVAFHFRAAFTPFTGLWGHGVFVAEILKERRQRRQPVPDGSYRSGSGDRDRRARGSRCGASRRGILRPLDAGKQHKVLDRIFRRRAACWRCEYLQTTQLRPGRRQPRNFSADNAGFASDSDRLF